MAQVSLLLQCNVDPEDQLMAYTSPEGFAIVLTNAKEEKISVCLTKDDASLLWDRLGQFLTSPTREQ